MRHWIDRQFYANFDKNWDDKIFRNTIESYLAADSVLLDLGAGAGVVKEMNFKDQVAKVCGIDPDPRVVDNPFLDEGKVATGESIPYPDSFFDIVVADNVFEHLASPEQVLAEVHRVLKPGGTFLSKTPNKYHYMPLIASLTPTSFHRWFNRKRGRDEDDTFPTKYRINCLRDIRRIAKQTQFEVAEVKLIEGRPEYLRFFWLAYLCGLLYERLVNSTPLFRQLRILLVVALVKPS